MTRRRFIATVVIASVLCGLVTANAQPPQGTMPPRGNRQLMFMMRESPFTGRNVFPQDFFVEAPTLQCAGFEWFVTGDENHNAEVTVQFREKGGTAWREGMPLLRIFREKVWGHSQRWMFEAPNMFAGSIFGLDPGATYECRFTMRDPDGVEGDSLKTVLVTTRKVPKPAEDGAVFHVYPPGYEGPREQPAFTGLNEAYYGIGNLGDWSMVPAPQIKPGDVILVHAGLYKANRYQYADPLAVDFDGAYILTQDGTPDRPITIKAAGDGEVVFDGAHCYRLFDVMAADYNYFEGLTIRNCEVAFYAGLKRVAGCSGLSVVNCLMDSVGVGVMTYWAGSKDFYIADNTLLGLHDRTRTHGWIGVEDPAPITSYVAIKVYGQGHVVCHNYIAYYHDGVCVDTHGLPEGGPGEHCASIDIYNNDVFLTADDFIEGDGGAHNIRIFDNRGFNSYHSALSGQPIFGGPAYFSRNICYHIPGRSLKFANRPTGLYVINNTFCTETGVSMYSNGHFRNNLFLGPRDDRPAFSSASNTSYTSFDYNGYRNKPGAETQFMWWQPTDVLQNYVMERGDMTSYTSLAAFSEATGQERHGVILDYDALEHVPMDDPSKPEAVYTPEGIDFTPKAGSAALDAGCVLPNITDGYIGKAPDLGAVERGAKPVVYGPRTGSRHP